MVLEEVIVVGSPRMTSAWTSEGDDSVSRSLGLLAFGGVDSLRVWESLLP